MNFDRGFIFWFCFFVAIVSVMMDKVIKNHSFVRFLMRKDSCPSQQDCCVVNVQMCFCRLGCVLLSDTMLIGNDKRQTSLSRVNWKALGLHEILLMQGGGGADHYETLAVFWIVSSSWALTARAGLCLQQCATAASYTSLLSLKLFFLILIIMYKGREMCEDLCMFVCVCLYLCACK